MRLFEYPFFRFLVVGCINTIFGYGCYILFLYLGLDYPIAVLCSTTAGALFNFNTIGRLVFKAHNNRLIIRFMLVYGAIYLLNVLFLTVLKNYGINPYYGGAILIIPMALISYILNKNFVFKSAKK